jgi:Na+/melibiose symporter-like transporter
VAWREGAGLIGVVLASALPGWFGWVVMLVVFATTLGMGTAAWMRAPQSASLLAPSSAESPADEASTHDTWRPWRGAPFRQLLGLFALNGVASAIAATLVIFFMQDRLGAAASQQPIYLGTYFLCAALSMPLWLRAVARFGLRRSWLAGMGLAIVAFVWALRLGTGDTGAFLVICMLTGVALGADLVAPPALLAGVIQQAGDRGRHDGAYLGWWNFATKLNLALAAGLALPLLQWAGYTPGRADVSGLDALVWVYAGLPCALKTLAALWLWRTLPTEPSLPPLKEALP